MNQLPINLQSIIHIINNWEFVYEDGHVKANIDVYCDVDELRTLKQTFEQQLISTPASDEHDDARQSTIQAINDLALAISELDK
jgi:hypothetical protein